MVRFLLLGLTGLALLTLCGCASLGDIMKAFEPVLDTAVQTLANSAGLAVQEQLGDQWSGGEIATAVTSSIVGLAAAAKAAVYAWNRKPAGAE